MQKISAEIEVKSATRRDTNTGKPSENFPEKLNYFVQLATGNILPNVVKVITKSLKMPLEKKV